MWGIASGELLQSDGVRNVAEFDVHRELRRSVWMAASCPHRHPASSDPDDAGRSQNETLMCAVNYGEKLLSRTLSRSRQRSNCRCAPMRACRQQAELHPAAHSLGGEKDQHALRQQGGNRRGIGGSCRSSERTAATQRSANIAARDAYNFAVAPPSAQFRSATRSRCNRCASGGGGDFVLGAQTQRRSAIQPARYALIPRLSAPRGRYVRERESARTGEPVVAVDGQQPTRAQRFHNAKLTTASLRTERNGARDFRMRSVAPRAYVRRHSFPPLRLHGDDRNVLAAESAETRLYGLLHTATRLSPPASPHPPLIEQDRVSHPG